MICNDGASSCTFHCPSGSNCVFSGIGCQTSQHDCGGGLTVCGAASCPP